MPQTSLAHAPKAAALNASLVSQEPATGAILWQGGCDDGDFVVLSARRAFPGWASLPLSHRVDMLRRLTGEIRREADRFTDIIARETGRPLWDARGEVESALARADASVRAYAERCAQRKQDAGALGTTAVRHKPLGVVLAITPFGQPLATPMAHIAPALLAGNAVVLKPAIQGSATAALLGECAAKMGLPEGVLGIVYGDGETAMTMACHDGVDSVRFSGAAATGQALARRVARYPEKLVALELGGNNAMVVWDTRQIEDAAVLVVQSAFTSSGQRPLSLRRLIVAESMAEPLLAAVRRLADRIICAAPHDEQTPFMGPVISNAAADGLTESFIWLISNGGRPIKHMQRLHPGLPFLSPAIIDVTDMADRPDVELFGPILQVIRVEDFDSAIAQANATRYGLVASLVGGTQDHYNRFWANTRAGLVHWNRPTIADLPVAPMGGVGMSGNYRPGGYYAADACAYPVSSCELDHPRAMIGAGFADEIAATL